MAQQAPSGENGALMKIVLVGANGKIGELVQTAMAGAGHEIVKVGHKSGDFQVEIENRESVRKLYQAVGSFDAVAIAAGQVAFASLWFRAFSMTTRSSPASRLQPSRARWKLLFGLPQLSFLRDCVSMW